MIGFDYTERIPPAALLAAGCSVVIRYTTWSGWAKSLTPTEADELHAAKIPVAANFESTADRMKGGSAAGHADALEARGHLGDDHMPTGLKIWFSADWDVQPDEVGLVLDYLHAAADVLGSKDLVGLYGGLRAVRAAADAGFGVWQTVAWSGGVWDPRAVARQTGEERTVAGVQVDVNEIINLAGLGAWGGPNAGEDVVLTPEDIQAVAAAVYNYGREDITVNGQVMHNAPLGQMVHGAWTALNDPAGAVPQMRGQVNDLHMRPAPSPLDVAALAAQLGPLLHPTTDVDALAAALAPHVGVPDPAAFAAALAPHIKVVSE